MSDNGSVHFPPHTRSDSTICLGASTCGPKDPGGFQGAATNRIDILDPALLRSGRLDRKIEFPAPTEEARARIMQIHARKMNVCPDVNYEELAR